VKYMMLIADDESYHELDDAQREATYRRIATWWNDHAAAGRIVEGHELQRSSTATTVRVGADGNRTVTDGPFAEGKEMVGGYAILDVPDLDAAIKLASEWPSAATLEIRPLARGD
jgi:hypothetical protein